MMSKGSDDSSQEISGADVMFWRQVEGHESVKESWCACMKGVHDGLFILNLVQKARWDGHRTNFECIYEHPCRCICDGLHILQNESHSRLSHIALALLQDKCPNLSNGPLDFGITSPKSRDDDRPGVWKELQAGCQQMFEK